MGGRSWTTKSVWSQDSNVPRLRWRCLIKLSYIRVWELAVAVP